MRTLCEIVAVAAIVGFGAASALAGEAGPATSGKIILAANCARCHAIEGSGKSPHHEALPFREVVLRYPPEQLAEALAEGIISGHPDMPEFTFEPAEIEAIVAYLTTLKAD
ncbi:c-type cytochrome [Hyphomicrobium sp. xq]|uniref:C-type cytochrome n=1 Tax=Hyphomicrobium album TaxID=2665159 RepID=A0A6I3KPM9_9HYPH|nr:cytochrome c [Hyphomicrobium album]MTD95762.1 c-type cytochrome [Hyphomicrobium album]